MREIYFLGNQFRAETTERAKTSAINLTVFACPSSCGHGHIQQVSLKVGEYHAPQGVVKVTPERLRHWEATTKSIQSVGYALPSHINHPDDPKFMKPLEMSVLKERKKPEAQKTVGHLRSFTVAPDGQSAEIVLETLTADAQEKVQTNTLFVSPVIMPEWKDGAGNRYADAITSWTWLTASRLQPRRFLCLSSQ